MMKEEKRRSLPTGKNKKVIGLIKDKRGSKIITKLTATTAKIFGKKIIMK